MVKEIQLTKSKIAFVDDEDYVHIQHYKYYAEERGSNVYARRSIHLGMDVHGNQVKTHIYMHHDIIGTIEGKVVDHINRNGLDNRRANLRVVEPSYNLQGMKIYHSSDFIGVHWYRQTAKWHAQIQFKGKRYHLGFFELESDAAKAYDKKALELYGEQAKTNFPFVTLTQMDGVSSH